jgi:hypothetical protein
MHYYEIMNTSQQITVRGVDDATKKRLLARARQRGMSLNAYNLELLRQDAGTSDTTKTNGLERFAGLMPFEPIVEESLLDQRHGSPDKWDTYGL